MSETAKKEWNVGDMVWAVRDCVVAQVVVEDKKLQALGVPGVMYYRVRLRSGKYLVWWDSCLHGTEEEAVRDAMDQLMDDLAIWTDNFRSLSVRLKELRTESDSATEKK